MILLVSCILGTIWIASGARILLVPPQIGSHVLEQIVIGEGLAQRGHQVFIAMGTRYPDLDSVERKGMKTLFYQIPESDLYGFSPDFDKEAKRWVFEGGSDKMAISYRFVSKIVYRDCDYMMSDQNFQKAVRDASPELAIVEAFLPASCNFILPKVLGIPHVSTSLIYMPWEHRFPALPSFAPLLLSWTEPSDITFISRLQNLLIYTRSESLLAQMAPRNNSLLEKFAPEINNWNELLHLSELFLVATDHHLGNDVPQLPNYISMAGVSAKEPKNLPEQLEEIMRNSKDGVILLSFGSISHFFPNDTIIKFLEAFQRLNQTVLVKFHVPDGIKVPANVKHLSWLPQNDLLGQPNMKLFITHCGNGVQHEALYHGVPIIGFPLFAEQHLNCQRCVKKGFGLQMNILDFTSDQLFDNLQEVLNNPKYRVAIQKASAIFRNQPMHPLNRTIFWIEHVIEFGGSHLRSFAMDMPLYEFLMLDIMAVLIIVGFAIISALVLMARFIKNNFTDSPKTLKLKST